MMGLVGIGLLFLGSRTSAPALSASTPTNISFPALTATTVQTTATEAPTFTTTPTLIPLFTPRPSASPTPDAIQSAINSGSLAFAGPLSQAEQIALYRASLPYIRLTAQGSRTLAKQINGVGYGDPTNICGPLAVAILRDAGLIPDSTVPHDFWLLNPNAGSDAHRIERVFPWEEYAHFFISSPINKTDWRLSPLLPGDFLFIWHGSGGNFDHMLVVSRVDSSSRTYAVTNYGTPDGYIISEALLYDPADSSAGLFHQWTTARDAILGSTGFGGFEVWRRRSH
ncbi:MAG TPA: hypothetical protein VMJ64_17755 [Anaerolineales bacterium]|nr:hypothetical protein [Anaerolineales bacterium]